MRLMIATAATLGASLFLAQPAAAQDAPAAAAGGEKVNQLIIYGDDPCPASAGDEITVCARKDEGERYRIPQVLREVASPQNEAWNTKVRAYETVGATGVHSCSPAGAGGWLGCTNKLIDTAYAEKRGSSDVKFGQMIAAEREKRLSTVDAEAAETQARVEKLENDYEARERARQEAEAAPKPVTPAPAGK